MTQDEWEVFANERFGNAPMHTSVVARLARDMAAAINFERSSADRTAAANEIAHIEQLTYQAHVSGALDVNSRDEILGVLRRVMSRLMS